MAYVSRTSKGSDLTEAELDANINAMGGYHGNSHAYFYQYYLGYACYHEGDTNTYWRYSGNDNLDFVAGGTASFYPRYYGMYLYRGYRESQSAVNVGGGTYTLYPYYQRVKNMNVVGNLTLTVGTTSTTYNHMNGLLIFSMAGNYTVSFDSDFVQAGGDIGFDASSGAVNFVPYYYHSGKYYLGKAWATMS